MIGKGQELKENEMYRAYKFRLVPTPEQKTLLNKHFGCVRYIFNHFLSEKQKHYLENKETLKFNVCQNMLIKQKKDEGFNWLKEVNSQSLVATLVNLETAYSNFFKKIAKFPKYKSKKGNHDSFQVPQHVTIKNGKIQIPKFKEGIDFIKHREFKGVIKSATISKTPNGKYYVSILSVVDKVKHLNKTGKSIGLDLGIKDFAITSEGVKYSNPKFLYKFKKKLRKAQKDFSRKNKESKSREKARIKVAKIYEKIINSRNDMQHKISMSLIRKYDTIAIEDLNVKGMVKNHKLAKAISDSSWSSFVTKLKYKAQWYGKEVVVIDRFYPSSKTCSCCDNVKEALNLDERQWTCSKCNTIHDRDVNASKNILRRALAIQSSGTDDYRNGVKVRPKEMRNISIGTGYEVLKKKGRKYTLKPNDL